MTDANSVSVKDVRAVKSDRVKSNAAHHRIT